MKLSIKSLLNTNLITSEQISLDCNISYDDIRQLSAYTSLIDRTSKSIQYKLYTYYRLYKETLLPMHTYLCIQNKFNIKNADTDVIFLDFFETKNEVVDIMGRNHFRFITGKNLEYQSFPFFILNYSDNYIVYHINDFESLIKHLKKIKPDNYI